jgi:RNA polymerase sigma factor (sigma-70 family)
MKATLDDTSFGQQTDACSEWFESALRGDEAAATRLYQHCVPLLRGWLATRLSETQAADLAHDAMVHAFRKHTLFRSGTVFIPWLRTLAWHMALNQTRNDAREQSRIIAWVDQQRLQEAHAEGESERRFAAMDRCLFTLPEAQRHLLHLHYAEKQTSQAIAESQGRTRSAIAVSIHRICQKMRRDLSVMEADDDHLVMNEQ